MVVWWTRKLPMFRVEDGLAEFPDVEGVPDARDDLGDVPNHFSALIEIVGEAAAHFVQENGGARGFAFRIHSGAGQKEFFGGACDGGVEEQSLLRVGGKVLLQLDGSEVVDPTALGVLEEGAFAPALGKSVLRQAAYEDDGEGPLACVVDFEHLDPIRIRGARGTTLRFEGGGQAFEETGEGDRTIFSGAWEDGDLSQNLPEFSVRTQVASGFLSSGRHGAGAHAEAGDELADLGCERLRRGPLAESLLEVCDDLQSLRFEGLQSDPLGQAEPSGFALGDGRTSRFPFEPIRGFFVAGRVSRFEDVEEEGFGPVAVQESKEGEDRPDEGVSVQGERLVDRRG